MDLQSWSLVWVLVSIGLFLFWPLVLACSWLVKVLILSWLMWVLVLFSKSLGFVLVSVCLGLGFD